MNVTFHDEYMNDMEFIRDTLIQNENEPKAQENREHRASCHRCGNIRKNVMKCTVCPHVFCKRCCDKMFLEHGSDIFNGGCPLCKDKCCCGSKKSKNCLNKYHCYKKCPMTRVPATSRSPRSISSNSSTRSTRKYISRCSNKSSLSSNSLEIVEEGIGMNFSDSDGEICPLNTQEDTFKANCSECEDNSFSVGPNTFTEQQQEKLNSVQLTPIDTSLDLIGAYLTEEDKKTPKSNKVARFRSSEVGTPTKKVKMYDQNVADSTLSVEAVTQQNDLSVLHNSCGSNSNSCDNNNSPRYQQLYVTTAVPINSSLSSHINSYDNNNDKSSNNNNNSDLNHSINAYYNYLREGRQQQQQNRSLFYTAATNTDQFTQRQQQQQQLHQQSYLAADASVPIGNDILPILSYPTSNEFTALDSNPFYLQSTMAPTMRLPPIHTLLQSTEANPFSSSIPATLNSELSKLYFRPHSEVLTSSSPSLSSDIVSVQEPSLLSDFIINKTTELSMDNLTNANRPTSISNSDNDLSSNSNIRGKGGNMFSNSITTPTSAAEVDIVNTAINSCNDMNSSTERARRYLEDLGYDMSISEFDLLLPSALSFTDEELMPLSEATTFAASEAIDTIKNNYMATSLDDVSQRGAQQHRNYRCHKTNNKNDSIVLNTALPLSPVVGASSPHTTLPSSSTSSSYAMPYSKEPHTPSVFTSTTLLSLNNNYHSNNNNASTTVFTTPECRYSMSHIAGLMNTGLASTPGEEVVLGSGDGSSGGSSHVSSSSSVGRHSCWTAVSGDSMHSFNATVIAATAAEVEDDEDLLFTPITSSQPYTPPSIYSRSNNSSGIITTSNSSSDHISHDNRRSSNELMLLFPPHPTSFAATATTTSAVLSDSPDPTTAAFFYSLLNDEEEEEKDNNDGGYQRHAHIRTNHDICNSHHDDKSATSATATAISAAEKKKKKIKIVKSSTPLPPPAARRGQRKQQQQQDSIEKKKKKKTREKKEKCSNKSSTQRADPASNVVDCSDLYCEPSTSRECIQQQKHYVSHFASDCNKLANSKRNCDGFIQATEIAATADSSTSSPSSSVSSSLRMPIIRSIIQERRAMVSTPDLHECNHNITVQATDGGNDSVYGSCSSSFDE